MIHLAPLLGSPVGIVCGWRTPILGLGLALGLGGTAFVPARPLHGFGCRHCLVDAAPIGSCGYATDVEFAAHLSRADGSSQSLETIRGLLRRSPGACCSVGCAAAAALLPDAAPMLLLSLPKCPRRLGCFAALIGGCARLRSASGCHGDGRVVRTAYCDREQSIIACK
jgi:hypothetical protein